MLVILSILVVAFVVLWVGAGIALSSVEKLSHRTHVSSFLVSFFALGLLTSVSEISVALFSTLDGTPSISVGNLLGASTVLTLLIIPLQILGNKTLAVNGKTDQINLPTAYLVISLPVILLLDGTLGFGDACLMLFSYLYLLFTISNKKTFINHIEQTIVHPHVNVYKEFLKVLFGAGLVAISGKIIVDNIILVSNMLGVAPFIIGLLVLSIGTNLPELSILIRSKLTHNGSIALGDYVGSASLNTLILSALVFANGNSIRITEGLKPNVLLLPFGAVLFLVFTKNKKFEKLEALFLLILYIAFIFLEFVL